MSEPLLTASDVRSALFGTTRLRAGYNMDEVDAFLDHVERTIAELTMQLAAARDHEAMQRAQVTRLQQRLAAVTDQPTQPPVVGADPIVREVRERLRRVLTEQLALLDQSAPDGMSSPAESAPPQPDR